MKPIFQEFYCPGCGQIRRLKVKDVCVNCRDIEILNKVIESRDSRLKI
ncbi:MAG: hypothetical protein ACFFD5_08535 [Candidatus Thorarchaeota archaeon]